MTTHLFVIPFGKVKDVAVFEKLMLDKIVMKTEIEMERRIYVFEDFDANDQADVFNIRDALKSEQKYSRNFKDNLKDKKKDLELKDASETVVSKEIVVMADGTQKVVENKGGGDEKKDDKEKGKDGKDKKKEGPKSIAAAIASIFDDDDDKNKSSLALTDILNCLDGICERTGINLSILNRNKCFCISDHRYEYKYK